MSDDIPIWQWNAATIADATRTEKVSATEVVEAAITRMEDVNPALNAVVESLADEARAEAAALDASDGPKGALHGVPVTIKINVDQKGHATTNGVAALKDVIASEDAPIERFSLYSSNVIALIIEACCAIASRVNKADMGEIGG